MFDPSPQACGDQIMMRSRKWIPLQLHANDDMCCSQILFSLYTGDQDLLSQKQMGCSICRGQVCGRETISSYYVISTKSGAGRNSTMMMMIPRSAPVPLLNSIQCNHTAQLYLWSVRSALLDHIHSSSSIFFYIDTCSRLNGSTILNVAFSHVCYITKVSSRKCNVAGLHICVVRVG